MMHPHFYHWHGRADLKPATDILEPRWKAAAQFAEKISASDICPLLRLVLFPGSETEFGKRFSEALVKLEPTFPPENNAELLRVMATAAIHSRMDKPCNEADAVALALHAATFPHGRIQPICKEVMLRAAEYLAKESERMRPAPNVATHFKALNEAMEAEGWQSNESATRLLGDAVNELGDTMGRISEENQFLWWLVGRRSSILNTRRDKLAPKNYALVAAAEAAERVTLLPPAASVESLLDEVLSQCGTDPDSHIPLVDILGTTNPDWVKIAETGSVTKDLTPIASLLGIQREAGKVDAQALKQLHLSTKGKSSPAEAARQYFRELMFLRALKQLS